MLFLRSNKRVPKFLLCADFFLFPGDNKKSVLFPGAHRVPHYGYDSWVGKKKGGRVIIPI